MGSLVHLWCKTNAVRSSHPVSIVSVALRSSHLASVRKHFGWHGVGPAAEAAPNTPGGIS
eukprot:5992379-Pyramimonas_sp.AAC.1